MRVRLVSEQNETRPISFTFQCHCLFGLPTADGLAIVHGYSYANDVMCNLFFCAMQELNSPSDDDHGRGNVQN